MTTIVMKQLIALEKVVDVLIDRVAILELAAKKPVHKSRAKKVKPE